MSHRFKPSKKFKIRAAANNSQPAPAAAPVPSAVDPGRPGPRTPEGKMISARNSTLHGLSGSHILLPHEDAAAFEQLCADLDREFHPYSAETRFLVRELAESQWLLARTRRLQAALFKLIAEADSATPATPDERIAAYMLGKSGDAAAKLARYEAAALRSYFKAHRKLEEIANSEDRSNLFSNLAAACVSAPVPGEATRFVLQTPVNSTPTIPAAPPSTPPDGVSGNVTMA